MCEPALAFSASSQRSAAASPYVRATDVTMGWKSVSPAAKASFPFHWGSASYITEVGSWLGSSSRVL